MGVCIEKLPHSCGSKNGLQVFQKKDGTYDGYCFSCRTYVPNPIEGEERPLERKEQKSEEEIQAEMDVIASLPTLDISQWRGINLSTMEDYGVKVGVSQVDGITPDIVFFPYTLKGETIGYKARLLDTKRMWSVGKLKGVELFGWSLAKTTNVKCLYITEGEWDAMAVYQMLVDSVQGTKWAHLKPAVVSLPSGATSVKNAISTWGALIRETFQEVVFIRDMDEPGEKAAEEFSRVFPSVRIATTPLKDANECLLQGRVEDCINQIKWKAIKHKNTNLIFGSSLKELAKKPPEWGLDWPWKGLTKALRGRRRGETIYFGGGVKLGKSEFVNAIAAHVIIKDNLPVLLIKPEENKVRTYQNLVGKAAGSIFYDPSKPFDVNLFDKYEPLIGDKAIILDSYQLIDWSTLKDDIRYATTCCGVQDVFIDPITCLTNTMGSAEANEFLTGMTAELAMMAKENNFTTYIFCHLKAPTNGPPHEKGGSVLSTQFAGSRAMMRCCHTMIGIEGNKDPDLDKYQRNVRNLVILEDREFGSSDTISLYWDDNTGLFQEIDYVQIPKEQAAKK